MSSQTVVETPSTETLLGCESEEPAPRYPPSKERSLTDLLRRKYELATSARPIHPPDTAAKIAQGFPAPAPFWVGLRPFILLMPFTGVGPAVFLMSHGSAAYICCAALLYAYLAFSGYRMGRGDLALARPRLLDVRHARLVHRRSRQHAVHDARRRAGIGRAAFGEGGGGRCRAVDWPLHRHRRES